MALHRDAPRDSLGETYGRMAFVNGTEYDATIKDYADLDDAELPPSVAVHLADMTGRPVEEFEGTDYDRPDLDGLEEVTEQ